MKRRISVLLLAGMLLLLTACGGGSSTSHSQEVTTRNLHKKVSFIFNPSRAGLQMQALAHLLVQV